MNIKLDITYEEAAIIRDALADLKHLLAVEYERRVEAAQPELAEHLAPRLATTSDLLEDFKYMIFTAKGD